MRFNNVILIIIIEVLRGPNEGIDEVLMFYLYHLMFYLNFFYMLC
jgi:hypothetical protein